MKKNLLLLALLSIGVILFVSCQNPESLTGTTWKTSNLFYESTLVFIDSNTVNLSFSMSLAGVSENGDFQYTYTDPDVVIEDFATGEVSGNRMVLTMEDIPTSITYWKK